MWAEGRSRWRRQPSTAGRGGTGTPAARAVERVVQVAAGERATTTYYHPQRSADETNEVVDDFDEFRRHPLDQYVLRRAWLGWTCHVATSKIEGEFVDAAREAILAAQQAYRPALAAAAEREAKDMTLQPPSAAPAAGTPTKVSAGSLGAGAPGPSTPTGLGGSSPPPRGARAGEQRPRSEQEVYMSGRSPVTRGLTFEDHPSYLAPAPSSVATGDAGTDADLADVDSAGDDDEAYHDAREPKEGGGLLHPLLEWLSKPQQWFQGGFASPEAHAAEMAVDGASGALGRVLTQRTLALCFHSWRVFLAEAAFLRQEEADKSALVISLWRAATSGLLDARGSATASAQASSLAGVAGILGLYSDDDDDDDDDEQPY